MITVYFETPNHSYCEQVATFNDEELYLQCLDVLKAVAKEQRMIVTETEDDPEDYPFEPRLNPGGGSYNIEDER